MKSIIEIIRTRRSVRYYKPDYRVAKSDIEAIIEAARWGPSHTNKQPWYYISTFNRKTIDDVTKSIKKTVESQNFEDDYFIKNYYSNFKIHRNVSGLIFVLYRNTFSFVNSIKKFTEKDKLIMDDIIKKSTFLSVGASVQNMLLEAHAREIDTCWMTLPLISGSDIEKIINVENPWMLISLILVGKAEKKGNSKRRELNKIWKHKD